MEERAQKLEEQIATLESTIAARESSLQNFVSAEETARLTQELNQCRNELQERTTGWEKSGEDRKAGAERIGAKATKACQKVPALRTTQPYHTSRNLPYFGNPV